MANITLTLVPKTFAAKLAALRTTGLSYVAERVNFLALTRGVQLLRQEAPKRTGAFANSITARQVMSSGSTRGDVQFFAPRPLFDFITKGTRPHDINAAPGSVLAFEASDGTVVFTNFVRHPGTKANPFQKRALDQLKPLITQEMKTALSQALSNLKT